MIIFFHSLKFILFTLFTIILIFFSMSKRSRKKVDFATIESMLQDKESRYEILKLLQSKLYLIEAKHRIYNSFGEHYSTSAGKLLVFKEDADIFHDSQEYDEDEGVQIDASTGTLEEEEWKDVEKINKVKSNGITLPIANLKRITVAKALHSKLELPHFYDDTDLQEEGNSE